MIDFDKTAKQRAINVHNKAKGHDKAKLHQFFCGMEFVPFQNYALAQALVYVPGQTLPARVKEALELEGVTLSLVLAGEKLSYGRAGNTRLLECSTRGALVILDNATDRATGSYKACFDYYEKIITHMINTPEFDAMCNVWQYLRTNLTFKDGLVDSLAPTSKFDTPVQKLALETYNVAQNVYGDNLARAMRETLFADLVSLHRDEVVKAVNELLPLDGLAEAYCEYHNIEVHLAFEGDQGSHEDSVITRTTIKKSVEYGAYAAVSDFLVSRTPDQKANQFYKPMVEVQRQLKRNSEQVAYKLMESPEFKVIVEVWDYLMANVNYQEDGTSLESLNFV